MSEKNKRCDCGDEYDYLGKSASVNDQTGLIPSAPLTEAEEQSYQMLYPYPPPVVKKEDDHAK
ncbi:MAG: hypothetical protein LUC32_06830 [Clostridiales bacterium]|nr:hypothetical protein [Clostridiales bacterium]MCD8324646.1 hypothetical protein [Clostridiales bacterium]